MANKYLLPCECGKSVPVDVGQSGLTISCDCGASLQVPTLQGLKHLALAESHAPEAKASWGRRQGMSLVGVLVALIGFAAAFAQSQAPKWSRAELPPAPRLEPLPPDMSPKIAYDTWKLIKKQGVGAGLGLPEREYNLFRRLSTTEKTWIVIYALIGVAGLVLAGVARFVDSDRPNRPPRRQPS